MPRATLPQNDQYQQKRRVFLDAAGLLLTESGVESFSLAKLADRLNITSAALYYYFKNKHDLIFECYALSFDLAERALDEALASGGDSAARLQYFIHRYMLMALRELQPTMSLRETTSLKASYNERIRQLRNRLHKRLRSLVTQGMSDGSIAPCDPALTIIAVIGALSDLLRVYDPRKKLQPEDIAAQISFQLVSGIAARDATRKKRALLKPATRSRASKSPRKSARKTTREIHASR
ncbi:TetR family transcriptional regulator [Bradyrhizobium sp. LHD-71]|uniref:TetR family transcriptional regulator n=1 Tax=Bradyrhizobium sp. LHD-71 TaxID=3072141 RepID=UPI00280F3201|nr:TetR family transcriptional regulator [Bradyrhizobium sp. LHD-71]MDQ8728188.1 TetR family transcriptional regulator [Bradyrhizobium sp. LHD-71]